MSCVAAALVMVVAAVRLWPANAPAPSEGIAYEASEPEAIHIDEIQPTRQAESAPPPPSPPIPILLPDDTVLEDPVMDFSDNLLPVDDAGEDILSAEGEMDAPPSAPAGPTVGPKTVRFVEPEYTREARRRRVRAELVVRVLVDKRGRVAESIIVERFLLDENGAVRTPVNELGYGLEEAALSAAERWMFRPARKDGEPVAAHTELTFTFGVDA